MRSAGQDRTTVRRAVPNFDSKLSRIILQGRLGRSAGSASEMMKAHGYGRLMRINGPVTVPAKLTIVAIPYPRTWAAQLMEDNLADRAKPLDRPCIEYNTETRFLRYSGHQREQFRYGI